MAPKARPVLERFMEKVEPEPNSGCWLWTAGLSPDGYGKFMPSTGRVARAHRAAWELLRGQIPHGAQVLHRCDNRICVNPDHLFLGTPLDNMLDKKAKGRTWLPVGALHPMAKLSENEVIEIRRLRESGETQQAIADLFGVSRPLISYICSGKLWPHLAPG